MLGEDGNHLPIPLVECPRSVKILILVVSPNISNDYNQHTHIK